MFTYSPKFQAQRIAEPRAAAKLKNKCQKLTFVDILSKFVEFEITSFGGAPLPSFGIFHISHESSE